MHKGKNPLFFLGSFRLPFVMLTPVCVFLGISEAYRNQGSIDLISAALALLGAVCAHLCVNLFNEYQDFRSGLDFKTVRTPFSGGSGTLVEYPKASLYILTSAWITCAITVFVGIYFIVKTGLAIAPIGIAGVVLVLTYSTLIVRNPFICLIAPGLGFGTCMVMGTVVVLTGHYTLSSFYVSLIPFFLVSNLLLLNQFPDAEADASVGRNHLPIRFGRNKAAFVYAVFAAAVFVIVVSGLFLFSFSNWTLISIAGAALTIPAAIGTIKHADNISELVPYMGLNVLASLITPILFGIGLLL